MAPISKENEVLTVVPDTANPAAATGSFRPEDTASRPQPVALEVPVTVNGARTVVGSDKREPFSETTKTVLVFGNGAVIRLGSPVSPGQLLFLTNEKTKKEVVCQVVKSKNYRSVSGYVELEFTEAVVGFWGMRFPSDRVATPVPARPVAVPPAATGNPVVQVPPTPQVASPVIASTPKSPGPTPSPVRLAPSSPVQPQASSPKAVPPAAPIPMALPVQSVMAPEAPATKGPEPPAMQVSGLSSSLATSLASLLGETEQQSLPASTNLSALSSSPQGKQVPSTGSKQNEDLKLQTARLQEQLSSLLFSPTSTTNATPHAPAAPAPDVKVISNVTAQVLEVAKSDRGPASSGLPSKIAPPPIKSSFDTEEVRIPAWLEPLARNAAAPASTQELIEREKAKHAAELAAQDEIVEEPLPITAVEPAPSPAPELPGIGNLLPLDEVVPTEDRRSRGSRKGLMLGLIAAGILIAAGGAWYFLQPANSAQNVTTPFPQPSVSQAHVAAPVIPPVQPPAQPNTLPNVASALEVSKLASSDASRNPSSAQPRPDVTVSKSAAGSQPASISKENPRTIGSTIPAAEKERISRPAPEAEPKKPALGEVHLATPMLNRHVAAQNDSDAAPTLGAAPGVSNAGGLDSALGSGAKQPAAPEAPLPVGGDVTPAKLLSSVSPVYPAIAKNQHVSGDVVIDALIDANGRVTTMKVISGPSLLHQAARDALHQWKYRPATLDGNPVPMHLTVKVQFRIQ